MHHPPVAVRVCLLCVGAVWLLLELRQYLVARHEARPADRGSIGVLRLAAVAGFAGAAALARSVPAAAIRPVDIAAWAGLGVLCCGVALRAWCFRTLGRYFTFTVQTSTDQPVVSTGPYRLLRHPSYTGLLLAVLGVAAATTGNWLSVLAVAVAVGAGLGYRIQVEERALVRDLGDRYLRYADTHKRLVPYVW